MLGAVDIIAIFNGLKSSSSIARPLAEFLGIIQSVDNKLDATIDAKYIAALESIQRAKDSKSKKNRNHELNTAKVRFQELKYTYYEICKYNRSVMCFVGEAICHYQLGEIQNTINVLSELSELQIGIEFDMIPDFKVSTLTDLLSYLKIGYYTSKLNFISETQSAIYRGENPCLSEEWTQQAIEAFSQNPRQQESAKKHLEILQIIRQAREYAYILSISYTNPKNSFLKRILNFILSGQHEE